MARPTSVQIPFDGKILHQLRLAVYPIIYKVLLIPGGDRRISSINSMSKW